MITKSMILTSGQNQFLYFWPKPTFFIMIKPHQQGFVVIFFFTWVPTCGYVPVTVKLFTTLMQQMYIKSCFVKTGGRFFSNFVAFSGCLDFKSLNFSYVEVYSFPSRLVWSRNQVDFACCSAQKAHKLAKQKTGATRLLL